jgi:hypothetical protein
MIGPISTRNTYSDGVAAIRNLEIARECSQAGQRLARGIAVVAPVAVIDQRRALVGLLGEAH